MKVLCKWTMQFRELVSPNSTNWRGILHTERNFCNKDLYFSFCESRWCV